MAGGPSQLELFDYKPQLQKFSGQPIPDSFIQGRRFAFMDIFTKEHPKLLGTVRRFARHGQSGAWVSALLPHMAEVVDDLAFREVRRDGRLQSRAGQALCQHGHGPVRPAQHGRLGHLRHRQRVGGSARLRRAAIGPARAARRCGQLGQRVLALDLSGRAAAQRRRADLEPEHAGGNLAGTTAAGDRRSRSR